MVRRVSLISALTLAATLAVPGISRAADAGPRVLVIPFSTLNVADSQQWIGRAVQESIIADFGHAGGYAPVAFQGQIIVEDNATAVSLAHKADADFVIRGAAQMVDKTLRITAQMIDARTSDTVTTASVTGGSSDLLKLEDDLSIQLRTHIAAAQQAAQQAAQAQAATQPSGGITYTPAQTYQPAPSYTPGYSYAPTYTYVPTYVPTYYDYGYPTYSTYPYYVYGGPTFFFSGRFGGGFHDGRGFGGRDRDEGRDFGGRGNGSGGGFRGGESRGGLGGGQGNSPSGGFSGGMSPGGVHGGGSSHR